MTTFSHPTKFIKAFVTLSDAALQNPIIVGRLSWSKFKRSSNKTNLFYRNICRAALHSVAINVSFYYYENGKRVEIKNPVFSDLVSAIDTRHEHTLIAYAFNKAQGYIVDQDTRSLAEHYARIQ